MAAFAGLLVFLREIPEKKQLPFSEAVYVWQRNWTPQVAAALRNLPEGMGGIFPLVAEVGFANGNKQARITRIRWKPEAFQSSGPPVTLVIRIGDSGAQTGWVPWACEEIVSLGVSQVEEARMKGVSVGGLQIDYDCPASRLGDYERMLKALREDARLGSLELSFTSLPSWLNSDIEGFRALAAQSDYFVLQVHALDLPKSAQDPVVVMNPREAEAAVARAPRVGAPYFVALPTYSSFVVFDESAKKVVDVISEDLDFSRVADNQRLLLGEAPSGEIGSLVSTWRRARPDSLFRGVFWYRLPVEGDVLNWPFSTWQMVRNGQAPQHKLQVSFQTQEDGFERMVLRNVGELPSSRFPARIVIQLEGAGRLVGADGGRWYSAEEMEADRVVFQLSLQRHDPVPLPVGRDLPIGWIRKTGPGKLVSEFYDE